MKFLSSLILASTLLVPLVSASVQSHQEMRSMHRADVQAKIDGVIDEEIWKYATRVVIDTETYPADNKKSQVKATAYMYENGESLFVAINAFDPKPSEIKAQYRSRDTIGSDDHIGIIIDTFNDHRNAFEFLLNPLGVQADRYRDEVRGSTDRAWNAIWYGAGQIHANGYSVEFEIPFSQFRFPDSPEAMAWGIEFYRAQPRNSYQQYSSSPKARGNNCYLCQVPKYHGFKELKPSSDFQITPSLVASRADEKDQLEDTETTQYSEWNNGSLEVEPGLDVRWGITQDNVVNLTLNPDFSQVAADADQVSINSSFSPSFPEKRAFFLEGRDSFKTSRMNLVHTRRIASPGYGLKLTGKESQHNYGLLLADDEETHITLPSSQGNVTEELASESKIAIGRYRLDVGEQSNVGVLFTKRSAEDYKSQVASLDGVYQWNTANKLSYQLAFSETQNPLSLRKEALTDDAGQDCALNPTHQDCIQDTRILQANEQGSAFNMEYKFIQPNYDLKAQLMSFDQDFRADLGNVGRVGFDKVILGGARWWFGDQDDFLTKWGFWGDWDKTYQHDGVMLEEEVELYLYVNGPKLWHARFGTKGRETYWDGELYDELFLSFYSHFDPLKSLRVWTNLSFGDTIDRANSQEAEEMKFELGSNWRLGTHISGTAKVKYRNMDVAGGELFNVAQLDLRLNLQFNLDSSLRLVLKGSSVNKDQQLYTDEIDPKESNFSTQLIYAYEPNPKTLCYIGYADNSYQDDQLEEFVRKERSVFMKLSYAFQT